MGASSVIGFRISKSVQRHWICQFSYSNLFLTFSYTTIWCDYFIVILFCRVCWLFGIELPDGWNNGSLLFLFQKFLCICAIMTSLKVFPNPPPSSVFTICEKNSDLVTAACAPAQVWFFSSAFIRYVFLKILSHMF